MDKGDAEDHGIKVENLSDSEILDQVKEGLNQFDLVSETSRRLTKFVNTG
jgi:hypothetical protein